MTLTAAELAGMRDTVTDHALEPVVIKRPGSARDAEKNPVNALATVAAYQGWLVPPREFQADTVSGASPETSEVRQQSTAILVLPYAANVRAGDVALVAGVAWRVLTVTDATVHTRVEVERDDR